MTTVEVRTQTRELVRVLAEKEDHEVLTLNVRTLKSLVELMRDYAIITHASGPELEVAAAVEKLIDYVDLNARSANEPVTSASFKTTYLAEVFNVSVTAINNWIDEGRFIDYHREPHKHARIPHFTPFQHRDGRIEPLGLIVERYRRLESKSFADDDERDMLIGEIEILKQKYGGKDFNDAFDFENLTSEQESDVSRWRFYQARLEELS
ncbi:hypothetical protein ACM1RC_14380 [Paenibacillus azoreducens]|uniref:hypothetical protein n=1 Tax=Paenibacillus azoreducens TaxID=116718 RepID=UPI0039F5EBF9